MRFLILVVTAALWCFMLCGCQKVGPNGVVRQLVGDWAEVQLPPGCRAVAIAADRDRGVAVLCADGRVFH